MKTIYRVTLLGAVAAVFSSCAGASQPTRQMARAEDGARIWRMTCAMCHNARPASEFDSRQWPVIVSHMRTHSELTRSDADAVAVFLSTVAADADFPDPSP